MKNIGVNLFSLRTLVKDEAGLTATLTALGEMGYTCAQFSGAPFDADIINSTGTNISSRRDNS